MGLPAAAPARRLRPRPGRALLTALYFFAAVVGLAAGDALQRLLACALLGAVVLRCAARTRPAARHAPPVRRP
jgi:hypothetical protein